MPKTIRTTAGLLAGVLAAACTMTSAQAGAPSTPASAASVSTAGAQGDAATRVLTARVHDLVPTGAQARARALLARSGAHVVPQGVLAAIDPGAYLCAPTSMDRYLDRLSAELTEADQAFLSESGLLMWSAYEAILRPAGPETFGDRGQDTAEVRKTFDRLRRFWDVDSSGIQLRAMHGAVVTDKARMVPVLVRALGMTPQDAGRLVDAAKEFLASGKLDGGRSPLLSFNAFAYSDDHEPVDQRLGAPDMIVLGDGLSTTMKDLGMADVEPRATLAHEYAHQMQMRLGLAPAEAQTTPEGTRAIELEADAMAGYYLAHPQGERLRRGRIVDAVLSFGDGGDCAFDEAGHHGTPNQRIAAASWGIALAQTTRPQSRVLPTARAVSLFRADLPRLLEPDAS